MKKITNSSVADLHEKKAEKLLFPPMENSQAAEVQIYNLVSELEAHQLELKSQNEELMLAKEQAETVAKKFIELYDFAPSGYFTLSKKGVIVDLNLYGSQMLGSERSNLTNSRLGFFVSDVTKPVFNGFLEKIFSGITKESCEVALLSDGNLPMNVHLTGIATQNGEQCLVSATDITEQKILENELSDREAQLNTLIQNIPDLIWLKDINGVYLSCNRMLERLINAKRADIVGKTDFDFFDRDIAQFFLSNDSKAIEAGKPISNEEWINFADDGHRALLETIKAPMYDSNGKLTGVLGIGRDITDRKQAEENIVRLNRLYSVISQINQTIVRIHDKEKLFSEVCRISVEFGKFQMAWVGLIDKKSKLVVPVSYAGVENGYLSKIIKISISDVPEGRGPTGTAIREGNHFVCNDIENNPIMLPWRDEALKRGYRSSISLPIKSFGKVMGAFTLYSSVPNSFDQEEIELLDQVANDISFALEAIKTEKKRNDAEKALKKSEHKYKQLVEILQEGVWVIDKENYTTYVNHRMATMLGYTVEEMLCKHLFSFMDMAGRKICLQNLERGRKGIKEQYDFEFLKKDGSRVYMILETSPITDEQGNYVGAIAGVTDITDRKHNEDDIKLKNEELIHLNAEKDKFFSVIAHDLRSPFNGFLGLTAIMADSSSDMEMDEIKKLASSMRNSATKLYRLLGNLLEWSRIQRGLSNFYPESFNLLNGIETIIDTVHETADKKMISISYDVSEDLLLMADKGMFDCMMRNFVFNAIKYTPKEGKVIIGAKSLQDHKVELSISDSGIGMDQTMISHLFNLEKNTNREGTEGEPSTGLGLIICKDFVERHGGTIRVESEQGKGSTFYFTLPGDAQQ